MSISGCAGVGERRKGYNTQINNQQKQTEVSIRKDTHELMFI